MDFHDLLGDKNRLPLVMGILNVTPDSFSDGGLYNAGGSALKQVEKMIADGVDIIDVGGESTRPGAEKVSVEDELRRVIPIIKDIKKHFNINVSIDTYKEHVARVAVEEGGADIINDISALEFSENMGKTIAELKVPVILMHIKGTPETMQKNPVYHDVVEEIIGYLSQRAKQAMFEGVLSNNIIIDPGICFGKRLGDNIEIIKKLKEFGRLGFPVLMGLSRKRFLGEIGGESDASLRDYESVAANIVSFVNGASIVRVHNVSATVKALKVFKSLI